MFVIKVIIVRSLDQLSCKLIYQRIFKRVDLPRPRKTSIEL